MRYLGQMKTYHSHEIPADCSVGIGFECIDRDMIKPEKCYNPLAACGAKYATARPAGPNAKPKRGFIIGVGWMTTLIICLPGA